jgi:hypothetical protein
MRGLKGLGMRNLAQGLRLCASENSDHSVDPLPCFGTPRFYRGSGARLRSGHPSSVLFFFWIVGFLGKVTGFLASGP